jgi:hypothetical protein
LDTGSTLDGDPASHRDVNSDRRTDRDPYAHANGAAGPHLREPAQSGLDQG